MANLGTLDFDVRLKDETSRQAEEIKRNLAKQLKFTVKPSLDGIKESLDVNINITDLSIEKVREKIRKGLSAPFTIGVKVISDGDTAEIMNAVKSVLEAQEKIINAATASTDGQTERNTAAAKENAEAVKQQAKSYKELQEQVDKVLGSIGKNASSIVEQKTAISLIDEEMKVLNKEMKENGELSEAQHARLVKLTEARERHKIELRKSTIAIQNDIKMGLAASGSMDELSQSLSRMRMAYRALNEEERGSQFGKDLLASIQNADQKIKQLDASVGNYQRNVGNYGGAYNGLNMSLQQIVRELPSATQGLQMFFLAISNNLPIFTDNLKRASEANEIMKKAGQTTVPVWRQVIKSVLSWQTALMAGISLLIVYGKEIAAWGKSLISSSKQTLTAEKAVGNLNDQLSKSDGKFSSSAMAIRKFSDEWKKISGETAQIQWIEKNKASFEEMGLSILNATDAERVFVSNTNSVIEALKSRARAEAARELAKDKYKEAFLKREKANAERESGVSAWDRASGYMASIRSPYTGMGNGMTASEYAQHFAEARVKNLEAEAEALEKEIDSYYNMAELEDKKAEAELKRLGILKEEGKSQKEQLEAQKANLQTRLDILSVEEAAGKAGESLRRKIEAIDKQLSAYNVKASKSSATKTELEAIRQGEAAEKLAGIITQQGTQTARAAKDMELSTRAAEIGAMKDSTEKTLLQIRLDEEKKVEAIEREYENLRLKRIEEAKKLWDADLTNKGRNFYLSADYFSAASDAQFSEAEKKNREARINEAEETAKRETEKALATQRQGMYDYLREYGSMQQQRESISAEYERKISEEQDSWKRKALSSERDRLLGELSMNELRNSIDWESVFSDLEVHSESYLQTIKEQLQTALNAKDITAENAKLLAEKIREIEDTIAGKTSIWQSVLPGLRERKRLTEDTADAQERLNKALSEQTAANASVFADRMKILDKLSSAGITAQISDIAEANKENLLASLNKGSELYKGLLQLFENLAEDEAEARQKGDIVIKSRSALDMQWDKLKGMNSLTDLFSFASGNPLEIIKGINENVQSMSQMVDNFGLENTDFGNAVHNFADGCQDFTNVIADLASGNVFGAVNDVLSGVASWSKIFYSGGNEAEMEEQISSLANSNRILADAIDSLSEKIADSDSTNAESQKAYRDALAAEKEWQENQRKAINARASEWSNTGHGFLGMSGKSSFNAAVPSASWGGWKKFSNILRSNGINKSVNSAQGLWSLSPEEMKLLRDFAPSAWEELFNTNGHNNPRELVEEYIERSGAIDELTSALNEKLTGYDWQGFKSSYLQMLTDLDSTNADFADNLENMLTKAILSSLVNEVYKERISALYKMIADAASSESEGGSEFTASELASIRTANESLSGDLLQARKNLIDAGIIKNNASAKASGLAKGIQGTTEATSNLLASYLNSIRADVSTIRGYVIGGGAISSLANTTSGGLISENISPSILAIAGSISANNAISQAQLQAQEQILAQMKVISGHTEAIMEWSRYNQEIYDILYRATNGIDKFSIT